MHLKHHLKLFIFCSLTISVSQEALAQRLVPSFEPHFPNHACRDKYQDLTASGKLETTYVHGYSDDGESKSTLDIYYQNLLIKELTAACKNTSTFNCGFKRALDDAEKFSRKIVGPDGNMVSVIFFITHSSYTNNNADNLTSPKQTYQTEHAKTMFARGLKKSQIVFYDGHSRNGGGPDFSPPHSLSNGHTDYDWYRARREGIKFMLSTIKESTQDPKFLALFSCSSINHFYKSVADAAPNTGFIGTNESLLFSDRTSYTVIDDVLNFRCLDKQVYPEPVHFKEWWTTEKSYAPVTENSWQYIYEKRVTTMYQNYIRELDPETKKVYFNELDKLTYIPYSLKKLTSFGAFNYLDSDKNYFYTKWNKKP